MKKVLIKLTFLSITFLFFVSFNVNASSLDTLNINNDVIESFMPLAVDNCEALLGDPSNNESPAYWFQWILNVMKYVAIIALLVLVIFDFLKAMTENDKEAIKKAGIKSFKRFIYCILLFFMPKFVEIIMQLFGAYGNCIG